MAIFNTTMKCELAAALQRHYGSIWYLHGVSDKAKRELLVAYTDSQRAAAIKMLKIEAVEYAAGVLTAGVNYGLVEKRGIARNSESEA